MDFLSARSAEGIGIGLLSFDDKLHGRECEVRVVINTHLQSPRGQKRLGLCSVTKIGHSPLERTIYALCEFQSILTYKDDIF